MMNLLSLCFQDTKNSLLMTANNFKIIKNTKFLNFEFSTLLTSKHQHNIILDFSNERLRQRLKNYFISKWYCWVKIEIIWGFVLAGGECIWLRYVVWELLWNGKKPEQSQWTQTNTQSLSLILTTLGYNLSLLAAFLNRSTEIEIVSSQ